MTKIIKKIILKSKILGIFSLFFYFFRIFGIKKNKIVCISFNGKYYTDNPKYIIDELISQYPQKYDIVWLVKEVNKEKQNNGIRQVKINTLKGIYEMVTAKIWISNGRMEFFVRKRKKQYYIQTWHGSLALKKIEYAVLDKLPEHYKQVMKNDTNMTDIMISNSTFCTTMYKKDFLYNGNILEIGSPRNDIFINKTLDSNSILDEIHISNDDKILLYAPTFRNSYEDNPYDIDFIKLKEKLDNITKENWKILIKMHPNVKKYDYLIDFNENVIDLTSYSDVQKLIYVCDLLITDYSSTMFEAMIAKKDVFLYIKDYEEYVNERGYYFEFNELPFEKAKNNIELHKIIENYKFNDSKNRYENFEKKVGLKETGMASKNVAELIWKQSEM